MILPKRAFLVDFDNTLIDTESLKRGLSRSFQKNYGQKGTTANQNSYKKVVATSGYFNVSETSKEISKSLGLTNIREVENIFFKISPGRYLLPGAKKAITKLKEAGLVIIYSLGDKLYQNYKIKESGIEVRAGKKNVYIVQDKKESLEKLIRFLRGKNYNQITLIDDQSKVLEKAYKIDSKITTVWIRFGKYKNKIPVLRSSITREVESITEASNYLSRFVAAICAPKSRIKLSVLREIDKNHVRDVIYHTKRDKLINSFTHDRERFKNIKTFSTWLKRNKTVYSLINARGKLVGIIWFAKKKFRNYPFTFAVRTYPPARGKGYSLSFIKTAYLDFRRSHKKAGIWLKTRSDNAHALSVYNKFGFKSISKGQEEETTMIYKDTT
jgi:FMN phosphatase YigB (HAD superfamily)/GNAT superfamily N-acetyltransferase